MGGAGRIGSDGRSAAPTQRAEAALARWLPLWALGAFWAGVGLAAWGFPTPFDWRYQTPSTLLAAAPSGGPVGGGRPRLTGGCQAWWAWGSAGAATGTAPPAGGDSGRSRSAAPA
jgi:hypothetical protein